MILDIYINSAVNGLICFVAFNVLAHHLNAL